tara:strand:- start:287 stop:919 length:633 start_codon:yes stop_codon:yes gene_type:complete
MFFDPRTDGMKPAPFNHSIFTSLVVPRPIGWISTIDIDGVVNLAPFSYFNAIAADPPCLMYCPNGPKKGTREPKDSLSNAEMTKEFVFNLCSHDLREKVNKTARHEPRGEDEMEKAGLTPAPSVNVKPPRVADAPIALECKYLRTVRLPQSSSGSENNMVLGQVIGIHVRDEVITKGTIDISKIRPIARLGGLDYSVLEPENVFTMERPD